MFSSRQKPVRLAVAAAVAAPLAAGLAAVPAHAGQAAWLDCPAGTTPAYRAAYTTVTLSNAEMRFQACRKPDGSLTRTKLSYVKKKGDPVAVALAWEWVTRDGKESHIPDEPNGGDHFPQSVSAGQTHTIDFPFASAGADGRRPAPRFSCIEGVLQVGPVEGQAKTYRTPKACF